MSQAPDPRSILRNITHVDEATVTLSVELVVRSHVHAVVAAQRTLAPSDTVVDNDNDDRLGDALDKGDHSLSVKLAQLQLRRHQPVHASRVLQLVPLVVADGRGKLLVIGIAGPHLGRGLLGELLAGRVPLAEILDGVGADLDGDLGQDGGALDRGDAGHDHNRGHALLEGLGGLILWGGLDGELPIGSLRDTIVSKQGNEEGVLAAGNHLLTRQISCRGGRNVSIRRSAGLRSWCGQGGGAESQLDNDGERELHGD